MLSKKLLAFDYAADCGLHHICYYPCKLIIVLFNNISQGELALIPTFPNHLAQSECQHDRMSDFALGSICTGPIIAHQ